MQIKNATDSNGTCMRDHRIHLITHLFGYLSVQSYIHFLQKNAAATRRNVTMSVTKRVAEKITAWLQQTVTARSKHSEHFELIYQVDGLQQLLILLSYADTDAQKLGKLFL